jgi:SSS family solute:Na+ symporter
MSGTDYFVLVLYLVVVCGIAAIFSGRQKSLKDYFMGDHNIPWYAAAFSGVATIVSAASFLGGPGVAFSRNLEFLQYRLAMPIVLGVICGLILPMFFRLRVYSIYEYLERRFDARVRLVASGLFLVLKTGYLAICIYAPAIVLARMSGLPILGSSSRSAASPHFTR